MKKKKVLIDLSILKNVHCGLGQVALNYGRYFQENYSGKEEYGLYLLVPKNMIGAFGDNVKYVEATRARKHFSLLIPKFDVWHAIHQLSRFRPVCKKTKYILTIHDFNFVYEKKGSKVKKYLEKIQHKIDRADKIVCISNYAKQDTKRYADVKGKTIKVIYNGVEQLDYAKGQKPHFITSEKPFFFTISQVKEKKNFHTLLPLMKLYPEKKLYIAGQNNTPYGEKLKETIAKENISNVFLTGAVNDEERIWLYENCEAFLFPSLFEGFGLPIIEAMYFGKPVFSSQETSLKEIGADRAFFWESFDAEEMKKVIDTNLEKFYSSPDEASKNIEYATSFSYEKHMQKYIAIYKRLLKEKKIVD